MSDTIILVGGGVLANRFTFFLVGGGVRPIGFAIILVGGDVQQKAYGASAARFFVPCRR